MTTNVSSILKIGLIGVINRRYNTNYNVNDIEIIKFTKNSIAIFTNDEQWFSMKIDMLESIE